MALTNQLRGKILQKLVLKYATGLMTQQEQQDFQQAMMTAIGNRLDTYLTTEQQAWIAELNEARTATISQTADIDTKITDIS